MKKYIIIALVSGSVLTSCGEYNKVLKSTDYEYKYEAAKSYFGKGQNTKAAAILEELITILKGTDKAEESLYMLGMTYYNQGDFITASHYFSTYYNTYPRGTYTEQARFYSGKALFLDTPEPRLDQSSTYKAIQELQMFMEYFPASNRHQEAQQMIFDLQDKLVMKDYMAARLYYDLGSYTGNSSYSTTGNNYLACIVTAQNALKDYPYTKLREDISILLLRAKYDMAKESVEEKKEERMRDAIDEYYAFKNEFPESKYIKEVENIYKDAKKYVKEINEYYKKTNAPSNTITRNMVELCEDTGNVYETVAIIGKRANQIAVEMKNDLSKKLQEFASYNDNLEEVFENREQIEISRYYEKLPKPTLIAAQEYEEGKVYYRNPAKEKEKLQ